MESKQFQSIEKKLDVIIGLLTMNLMKDKMFQEQAEILRTLGLTQGEIAKALGKTVNNVKNALHEVRHKRIKNKLER